VDEQTTKNIVKSIKNYRGTGEKNFDDIILSVLMEKDNYKQALNLLKTATHNGNRYVNSSFVR